MNRADLINILIKDTGYTRQNVESVVVNFIKIITSALHKGDHVTITGFGRFYTKTISRKYGRNFKTGDLIKIGPRKAIKFKVGKALKNIIK